MDRPNLNTMSRQRAVDYIVFLEHLLDPSRPEPPTARRADPTTSKLAATQNVGRRGTQRYAVFLTIGHAGERGLTAEQLERATGIEYRSLTPRIGELKRGGWVYSPGLVRASSRGASQAVNVLTDKGRAKYAAEME